MSGHFFIVDGDLTSIACDAWLLPTDADFDVTRIWTGSIGLSGSVRLNLPPWGEDEFARPHGRFDRSEVWLGRIGGEGTTGFIEAAEQFVRGAAKQCAEAAAREGRRPLLAINQIGSGSGGGRFHKGEGLPAVMDAVRELLETDDVDADVVLVAWGETAEAAAQWYRAENNWHLQASWRFAHNDAALRALAEELAVDIRNNRASIFLGAGVSTGAGLPTWTELLESIGAKCSSPVTPADIRRIADNRDVAELLSRRLKDSNTTLGAELAGALRASKYSLQHALLASLPCSEYITTNVDDLFERACRVGGRSIAVAPNISPDAPRWLLKLHGCVTEPESMVFTRDSYLEMTRRGRALMGLVQAMLLTRHMIFVGYSLRDEDFHELMFEVRSAFPDGRPKKLLGTVLTLIEDPIQNELWQDTVKVVAFHPPLPAEASSDDRARAIRAAIPELQKFLDLVGMLATDKSSFMLDATYAGMLTDDEREFARAVVGALPRGEHANHPLWTEYRRMLTRFGLGGGR